MYRTTGKLMALLMVALIVAPASAYGEEESALRLVTFTFAPHRQFDHVFLAGTFNGWDPEATEMELAGETYELSMPLAMGEYQYKFVADGEWITDEKAKRFLPDGYGGRNSVIDVDESFPGMDMARGDGRIFLLGLGHRGDEWERSLGEGGAVTIRTRAWKGDVEGIRLIWSGTPDGEGCGASSAGGDEMTLFDCDGTYDYFTGEISSPSFSYYFVLEDGESSVLLDREGPHADGAGDADEFEFDAAGRNAFRTPDWVKDGVFYQIFPERFANGDPGNDPDFSEWYYEDVTELPPSGKTNGEYFHLVEDWYDVAGLVESPYKTDGKPDWNSFYGGDIEGVRANLDYLSDLGVTIIYFNPIFEARSNHKYDAVTYAKVDPHFGTNEEFAAFVSECHEAGIRVVIDLAINHTGHTHWAFLSAREKGEDSEHWDWFEFKKWPVPGSRAHAPANPLDYYDCWWGFGQMPNLNFDLSRANPDEQSVTDINDAEPNWPLVNHLLDVTEYWLSEVGVDGFRLDVAIEVPVWFWELFRERVHSVNPDAYIVGELWGESPEWVNARYFDAVMNYKYFRDPVLSFIARGDYDAQEFDRALAPGRLIYAEEGVRAQMNLLDSHDTERFLTTVGGDVRRLKLAALFAMTYVGAPSIYYGDEIAMEGVHDPDCRRPFRWDWAEAGERVDVRDHFRSLAHLRTSTQCLTRGDFETLHADGAVFSFRRGLEGEHAVVVMNAGEQEETVTLNLGDEIAGLVEDAAGSATAVIVRLKDHLSGETVVLEGGAEATVTLPPMAGRVYLLEVQGVTLHPERD
jgi:glycosidase